MKEIDDFLRYLVEIHDFDPEDSVLMRRGRSAFEAIDNRITALEESQVIADAPKMPKPLSCCEGCIEYPPCYCGDAWDGDAKHPPCYVEKHKEARAVVEAVMEGRYCHHCDPPGFRQYGVVVPQEDKPCSTCGGSGEVVNAYGMAGLSHTSYRKQPCPDCGGDHFMRERGIE